MVLDRSGVTGPDGASHDGMWDLSLMSIIPSMRVAAPRDPQRLREEIAEAIETKDGPTVVRYPKGIVTDDFNALERTDDGVDILCKYGDDILIVGVGTFARRAVAAAHKLAEQGIQATVVDPRWILPIPASILAQACQYQMVVVYEDNGINGGIGSVLGNALRMHECDVPLRQIALPQEFLPVGTRKTLLEERGLDAESAAERMQDWFRHLTS